MIRENIETTSLELRPAGRAASLFVLVRSAAATLRISIETLWDVYRGRHRRQSVDRRLRRWSARLLGLARMDGVLVNPDGVEIPRDRPVILMSNHASLYDIPLIFFVLPGSIRMLTKKELFTIPIWGRGMVAAEFISVDRKNHERALRDLEVARRKMADGIAVWLAPEGTRSIDGALGLFKKGGFMLALQTGAMIVPIGIRGTRQALPTKTLLGLCYGAQASVHIGRPIDACAYGSERRDDLMREVRARIEALAGL